MSVEKKAKGDKESAEMVEKIIDLINTYAALVKFRTPLGPLRTKALIDMCVHMEDEKANLKFEWPRRGGLTFPRDYCKTSTLQLFLLFHIASGTTSKVFHVKCMTMRNVRTFTDTLVDWVRNKLKLADKLVKTSSNEIQYAPKEKGDPVGHIFVTHSRSGLKRIKADVLLCDDVKPDADDETPIVFILGTPSLLDTEWDIYSYPSTIIEEEQ